MTATDQKREKKLSNNGQGGYLPVAARKLNLVEVFFVLLALFLSLGCGLSMAEKELGGWSLALLPILTVAGILLGVLYRWWYGVFGRMPLGRAFCLVFGAVGGKVVLVIMLLAFLAVAVDLSYTLAYFWGMAVGASPFPFLAVLLFLVCVMAAAGKTVIGRLANLVVFGAVVLLALGMIVVMDKGDLARIPFTAPPAPSHWLGQIAVGFAMSFGLAVVLLPFLYQVVIKERENGVKTDKKKETRFFFAFCWAVGVAAIVWLLVQLAANMVLGGTLSLYPLPFLQMMKQFSLGSSFNQTELIGVLLYETIGTVALSFLLCAMNQLTAEILPLKGRRLLPIAWWILLYVIALALFSEQGQMLVMVRGCMTWAVWLAAVFLPLLTLLVYQLRFGRKFS